MLRIRPMHQKAPAVGIFVRPRLAFGAAPVFPRSAKGQCFALDLCLYGFAFYVFPVTTLICVEKLASETPGLDKDPCIQ